MTSAEELLRAAGQGALEKHLAMLSPAERQALESDLSTLSVAELSELRAALKTAPNAAETRFEQMEVLRRGENVERDAEALTLGRAMLARGEVAALIVAGGQGTRLGLSGPKGKFPAGPVTGASLFSILARKVLRRSRDAGRSIPLCVMTGPDNDAETRAHFAEHGCFGLDPACVHFFVQGTLPAVDADGALLLKSPTALFRSPDGHGGTLRALQVSGLLGALERAGIKTLFYFQVDNPLVDVCDPWFIGMHALRGSEFSSKAVLKRGPDEKVGVLGRVNGVPGVIEYSDLPAVVREARNEDGTLRFGAGNIAIHAIELSFVKRIVSGQERLPLHLARKDIPSMGPDGAVHLRPGIKFETFIFDAMRTAAHPLLVVVRREDEFSPIKNRAGEDSPESCRRDQMAQWLRWLDAAGVPLPRDAAGAVGSVEISPLTALGPEDLAAFKGRGLPTGDVVL